MIKVVVFDLWETLVTKGFRLSEMISEHFGIERGENFLKRYESSIQLEEWENEEAMARNFLKEFGLEETQKNIDYFIEALRKSIKEAALFEGMKELLVELKKNYKLGLLSNTTVFADKVLERLGIADLFDESCYSWQVKSLKPDRGNFEMVCKRLGFEPGECVFIDDNLKNIEAAKEVGLEAIHFTGVDDLKKELKKKGVL